MGMDCFSKCCPPASPGEIITVDNVGSGEGLFRDKIMSVLNFKTLVAGPNITLTATSDEIEISAAPGGMGEVNTASNLGGGVGIFEQKTGVDFEFNSLTAGTNITFDTASNPGEIIINAQDTDTTYSASNLGTLGQTVFESVVGTDFQFNRIRAGANISVTKAAGEIIIDGTPAPGGGEINDGVNLGGDEAVYAGKSGLNLQFKGLTAGSNITLTGNANDIVIDATTAPAQNLFETVVGDTGTYTAASPTDLLNIVGGTDISTSLSSNTLTIDFTGTTGDPDQNLWLTIAGDTGSTSANTTTDTLTIAGGSDIETSVSGDTLTINFTGAVGAPDQNLFETFVGDTGTYAAASPTDLFNIVGGTDISTSVSSNTMTINFTGTTGDPDQNLYNQINADSGGPLTVSSTTDTLEIVGGTNVTTSVAQVGATTTVTVNATAAAGGAFDGPYEFTFTVGAFANSSVASTQPWFVSGSASTFDVTVNHNLGKEPRLVIFRGDQGTSKRILPGIPSTQHYIELQNGSETTQFTLTECDSSVTGTAAGNTCTAYMYFEL